MMLVLKKRLKANSFYFSLLQRFSCDFAELLAGVDKYINVDKGMAEKQKEKAKQKMIGRITLLPS